MATGAKSSAKSFTTSGPPGENPNYGEPDKQGFVGVSPEYANYANATDEPLEAGDEAAADEADQKSAKSEQKQTVPPVPASA